MVSSMEEVRPTGLEERVHYALNHHFQNIRGKGDRYAFMRRVLTCLLQVGSPSTCIQIASRLNVGRTWVYKRLMRLQELSETWGREYGFRVVRTQGRTSSDLMTFHYHLETVEPWQPTKRQIVRSASAHPSEVDLVLDDVRQRHLLSLLESFGHRRIGVTSKVPDHAAEILIGHATHTFEPYDRPEMAIVRRVFEARKRGKAVSITSLREELDLPFSRRLLPHKVERKSLENGLNLGFIMECEDRYMSMDFLDPNDRRAIMEQRSFMNGDRLSSPLLEPVLPNFPEFSIKIFRSRLKAVAGLMDEKQRALFSAVAEGQGEKTFREAKEVSAQTGLPDHRIRYRVGRSPKQRLDLGMYLRYRGDRRLECMLLDR